MNRLVVTLAVVAATVPSLVAQTPQRPKGWCGDDAATYITPAQKGDADAMLCMGIKHSNVGTGVKEDATEATRWFVKAANAGSTAGMFFAGVAFWSGRGIEPDIVEAYKWLDLSAKLGNTSAISARDGLTRVLTKQQIDEAKKREADWERDFQKRKKS